VTAAQAPERPRAVLVAFGRSVGFIIMLYVCGTGVAFVIPPLVRGVYAATGYSLRGDLVANLVAVLAATVIMVKSIDPRPWEFLGLHHAALNGRAVGIGFLIGAVAIALPCGLLYAMGELHFEPLSHAMSFVETSAYTTGFLFLSGLWEEVMCRGYLLSVLRDGVGARSAVILTSVAFGILHLGNPGVGAMSLVGVVLAGVLLASVRLAFDSLYAAWMTHVGWNWVMAVPLHAAVSGYRFESPNYQAVTSGPAWFSGGSWGPEGGLAAVIGMGGALAYLYARHRREES
jgi:membrane protease YdiL (CAAX protease family)